MIASENVVDVLPGHVTKMRLSGLPGKHANHNAIRQYSLNKQGSTRSTVCLHGLPRVFTVPVGMRIWSFPIRRAANPEAGRIQASVIFDSMTTHSRFAAAATADGLSDTLDVECDTISVR